MSKKNASREQVNDLYTRDLHNCVVFTKPLSDLLQPRPTKKVPETKSISQTPKQQKKINVWV